VENETGRNENFSVHFQGYLFEAKDSSACERSQTRRTDLEAKVFFGFI
jgi:hypothetical protein